MSTFFNTAGALLICVSMLCKSSVVARAQTTPVDPQTAAILQAKLDGLITTYNLKGLSASVIIPGKGTWNGVSGISHAGVPIDSSMVFAIGSITKSFTSAAILLLQQDSLLQLSDSLHEFLPAYPNVNPDITIKQLLQHTSGIYNYFNHPGWINAVNTNPGQAMTPQFVLNNYVNAPVFAPGAMHQYSNTNFLLLGLIIESLSGQTYAQFIRQRLLNPLQLTSFYMSDHEPAIGVRPHNWSASSIPDPGTDIYNVPLTSIFGTSAADGALMGNAYDLARWGRLLFSGQVMHDTSLQLMTQFMPVNVGLSTGYGLGLMRFGLGNGEAWGHTGAIRGFSASLAFSPGDSIVVSVLSNKTSDGHTLVWTMLNAARQALAVSDNEAVFRDALVCLPNPAKSDGRILYTLRQAQQVKVTLQNVYGQTVQTLLVQTRPAGQHSLDVDLRAQPPGVYFCTLETSGGKLVQRWVLSGL